MANGNGNCIDAQRTKGMNDLSDDGPDRKTGERKSNRLLVYEERPLGGEVKIVRLVQGYLSRKRRRSGEREIDFVPSHTYQTTVFIFLDFSRFRVFLRFIRIS